MVQTPVAFIIFNRPDLTQTVFDAIRRSKPQRLFVIADGPRDDAETEKCKQSREVLNSIDWNCELITNFSDVNLGCKLRLSTGISWLFEQVDEAIILEDDCMPDASFFLYCETMLKRYRYNEQVMHISGANFQDGLLRGNSSYYFSKYSHIWGWATWKRAWVKYDVGMNRWPEFKNSSQFNKWCFNREEKTLWTSLFDLVYTNKLDTWDYQWLLAIIIHNGLCVMPNRNLISNIGFREDATHTLQDSHQLSEKPTQKYIFPDVIAPIEVNREADEYTFTNLFSSSSSGKPVASSIRARGRSLFNHIRQKLSI